MLEIVTLTCTVMSQRKYTDSITPGESGERSKSRNRIHKSSHHDTREHKYSRNSSDDPAISSTRSDKHVSTNARSHPRAELKESAHTHSHRSKHVSSNNVHNHISPKSHDPGMRSHDLGSSRSRNEPSTPNRKRSHENMEDDMWTEHTSSSGRVYYYNKKLDKSQWERPPGFPVKKAKTETTPDNLSSSVRKTASTLAGSSLKHSSHSHHPSHHHKDHGRSSSQRSHHTGGSHTHHLHDRKERYERSHHSSSRRGSPSRSHSRSSSPVVGGSKSDRGKYSSRGHTHSSRGSGYERSKEKERESGSRHSKSEHTTPTSKAHTTTSPCTPGRASGNNLSQTGLVSPSSSTPHSSTPCTSLTTTTPINSTSVAILTTPQGSFIQPMEQAMPGALSYAPQLQQQQQQTSNGIYIQDAGMGGVPGVAMGYVGVGGGNLSSPQTVGLAGIDAAGLHPLQKALLTQNQVPNYALVEPSLTMTPVAQAIPHHMTQQQSHPSSPLLQSPISIPQHVTATPIVYSVQTAIQATQPLPPVQQRAYAVPSTTPHGNFDPGLNVSGGFVTMNSPTLRTPMSSLGYQRMDSTQFPDPSKLEAVGASQVNMELFNRSFAEPWNQYHNQVQQQIESCQLESLQRRTTETIFLSSKLARSRLRLETSQISTTSRDNRLSGLRTVIEDISSR